MADDIVTQLEHKKLILKRARRVVIKIGSSILSGPKGIDRDHIAALVEDGSTLQVGIGAIPNAVLARLGQTLGLSALEAAAGVQAVVCEAMASAARVHLVEKGKDPRAYAMVGFGGAGPAHAVDVARAGAQLGQGDGARHQGDGGGIMGGQGCGSGHKSHPVYTG